MHISVVWCRSRLKYSDTRLSEIRISLCVCFVISELRYRNFESEARKTTDQVQMFNRHCLGGTVNCLTSWWAAIKFNQSSASLAGCSSNQYHQDIIRSLLFNTFIVFRAHKRSFSFNLSLIWISIIQSNQQPLNSKTHRRKGSSIVLMVG